MEASLDRSVTQNDKQTGFVCIYRWKIKFRFLISEDRVDKTTNVKHGGGTLRQMFLSDYDNFLFDFIILKPKRSRTTIDAQTSQVICPFNVRKKSIQRKTIGKQYPIRSFVSAFRPFDLGKI